MMFWMLSSSPSLAAEGNAPPGISKAKSRKRFRGWVVRRMGSKVDQNYSLVRAVPLTASPMLLA